MFSCPQGSIPLTTAVPRLLDSAEVAHQVVTVCDRAHEELEPTASWWHWSTPDPVETGTRSAFDAVVGSLDRRIRALT